MTLTITLTKTLIMTLIMTLIRALPGGVTHPQNPHPQHTV